MKKIFGTLFMSVLLVTFANAQPAPAASPSATTESKIVLANGETVSGIITDNIRKKGEIIVQANGKKVKYKADDISHVQLGNITFITTNYTFYEVLFTGKNLTLLRKANEPSGLHYSGSEAVVISSEGNIDDLFIKKSTGGLQLLTSKNVKDVLGQSCSGSIVDDGKFDVETIKKAVASCD